MKKLVLLLLVLISNKAQACECNHVHFNDAVANSTAIFSGLIIDKDYMVSQVYREYHSQPIKYKVVIIETWKGEPKDTIEVYTGIGHGDCGIKLDVNKSYVFWTDIDQYGFTSTNICKRTCLLERSLDIDLLNHIFKGAAYDTSFLTQNERSAVMTNLTNKSVDLSKTSLFVKDDKLISKMTLIDDGINGFEVEYLTFPTNKLKLLPKEAIHGALIIEFMCVSNIKLNKIVKIIRKHHKSNIP